MTVSAAYTSYNSNAACYDIIIIKGKVGRKGSNIDGRETRESKGIINTGMHKMLNYSYFNDMVWRLQDANVITVKRQPPRPPPPRVKPHATKSGCWNLTKVW